MSAAQFTICVMPKAWSSVLFEVGIMPEINRNGVISLTTCGVNCCNKPVILSKTSQIRRVYRVAHLFFSQFSRSFAACTHARLPACNIVVMSILMNTLAKQQQTTTTATTKTTVRNNKQITRVPILVYRINLQRWKDAIET